MNVAVRRFHADTGTFASSTDIIVQEKPQPSASWHIHTVLRGRTPTLSPDIGAVHNAEHSDTKKHGGGICCQP